MGWRWDTWTVCFAYIHACIHVVLDCSLARTAVSWQVGFRSGLSRDGNSGGCSMFRTEMESAFAALFVCCLYGNVMAFGFFFSGF